MSLSGASPSPGWDGGSPASSPSSASASALPLHPPALPWPLPALRSAAASLAARLARFWHYYHELLTRAALTLGMLVVIRAGHFIPLPGVELASVPAAAGATAGERLIKALYGQAGDLPACLFDLGISPFINASILLAVAMVVPAEAAELLPLGLGGSLSRLREARREGRSGEAVLNSATNMLALGFAVCAAVLRALALQPCALLGGGGLFMPSTCLALVAGSCVIHMAADTVTAFGLGNGSSLVICASIITEYASTLHTVLSALDSGLLSPGRLLACLAGYLGLVWASVMLATAELRLPVVQYAASAPPPPGARGSGMGGPQDLISQARLLMQRKSSERTQRGGVAAGGVSLGGQGGNSSSSSSSSPSPTPPGAGGNGNAGSSNGNPSAGPAVAASPAAAAAAAAPAPRSSSAARASEYFPLQLNSSGMMSIVLGGAAYYGFLPRLLELTGGGPAATAALASLQSGPLGLLGYGLTVAALEFLPLGGVNPKEMAEYFATMNVGLKGVVPGAPTERELRLRLLQCKAWGGACLGLLAVAAQCFDAACVAALGTSLGTTSLLIIVGAVLQTARQVEGLLEGPKLQRRLDREREAIQSLKML